MFDPLLYGYKEITCPVCGGKGIIPTPDGKRWQLCPKCLGRGKIKTARLSIGILHKKYFSIAKTW